MISSNETNGMVMPVAPYGGGGYGNSGFGGDWAWIILLLLAFGGGWGNGMGGFGGGMWGADGLYPWLNNSQNINGGFRDQMLNTQLNGIQNGITSGFGDVQTALCSGFAGVTAGINNGFAQAEISANARQIADMNQNFALQSSLQNCCCENRAAIADLKFTVANEACADRAAVKDALQAVTAQNAANTQRVLDQMCADKLEAKDDLIANLRSQLQMAQLSASQIAQTAQIVDQTYTRLSTCPVGTVPVFGEQPIFRCNNNNGCGCGCGGGNF